jgi:hypothetical protein
MQVTSGLKKRSPFAFASDEDNLLEDTAFLDDQGESSRLLVLVYSIHFRHTLLVHLTSLFRTRRSPKVSEGGE